MTHRLIIRPEAEAELTEASRWYEEQAPGLGERFLDSVGACLASSQDNPMLYPVIHEDVRRSLTRRFPYCVFYLVRHDTVVVLAFLHASRNPEHWQRRR